MANEIVADQPTALPADHRPHGPVCSGSKARVTARNLWNVIGQSSKQVTIRTALVGSMVLLGSATPARALQVINAANWSTAASGTASGALGSTTITLSGLNSGASLGGDAPYSSDPGFNPNLSAGVNSITYDFSSDWTAAFSAPVTDLALYMGYWRGAGSTTNLTTYTFDQAPILLPGSGCTNGSITGNTLTVDYNISGFCNGILQFSGTFQSLTVASDGSTSQQSLTFATLGPDPTAVPGPLPLLGTGAAFAWSRRLRRRIATRSPQA